MSHQLGLSCAEVLLYKEPDEKQRVGLRVDRRHTASGWHHSPIQYGFMRDTGKTAILSPRKRGDALVGQRLPC